LDSMTDTPSTLYNIVERYGLSWLIAAAKLPRAFWSTSEEAIHKAQVAEIGGLELDESAILLLGLNAAIGSPERQG
jgi:hypothetical protein